LPSSLGRGIWR